MKKDNKHLFLAIIGILVLSFIIVFFGKELTKEIHADTNLKDSYQLEVVINGLNDEDNKANAEIIKKRLVNFGADSIDYIIEGNKTVYTFTYNGDIKNITDNITRKGELSIRNSQNEVAANTTALDENTPLILTNSGNQNVVYLIVGNSDELSSATLSALISGDVLVLWVDYDETLKFEEEVNKENPGFLCFSSFDSAVSDSFGMYADYHTKQYLFNEIAIVNSGALTSEVKLVDCSTIDATLGAKALEKVLTSLWASIAVSAVYMIVKNKLTGVVNALMILGYTIGSLISIAYLGILFDTKILAVIILSLVAGLSYLFTIDHKLNKEMASGRNPKSSFDNIIGPITKAGLLGYGAIILTGIIGTLFFKKTAYSSAILAIILGVCGLLFFVLWNRALLSDLMASNYFDRNLFGYSDSKETKVINLASIKKATIVFVALALIEIAFAAYGFINTDNIRTIILTITCCLIGLIITSLYLAYRYGKVYGSATFVAGLFATIGFVGLMTNVTTDVITIVSTISLGCLVAIMTLFFLKNEVFTKGKLSNEKLADNFNASATELVNPALIAIIFTVIYVVATLLIAVRDLKALAVVIIGLLIVLATSLLAGKLWLDDVINNNGKAKKKTKNNELTEKTVFGLNNVR